MNLIHIRYFYDTVRLGSVSQAAKENHVTQSAVSQGIMKLEQVLGVQLLTHRRNRIKVTAKGERVFSSCRNVMKSVSELEQATIETKEFVGELVFACSHSLAESIVEDALLILKQQAPQIKVKVRLGHTGLVKQWLKQGHVEFGIVLDNDDLSDLETEELYRGTFEIYRSNKRKNSVPKQCLFVEPRAEVFVVKRGFHERYGFELATQLEINSWTQIANLVQRDMGFGFIPDFLTLNSKRGRSLIPCSLDIEPITYRLMLAFPKGEMLSRNGMLFLKSLSPPCASN